MMSCCLSCLPCPVRPAIARSPLPSPGPAPISGRVSLYVHPPSPSIRTTCRGGGPQRPFRCRARCFVYNYTSAAPSSPRTFFFFLSPILHSFAPPLPRSPTHHNRPLGSRRSDIRLPHDDGPSWGSRCFAGLYFATTVRSVRRWVM